MVRAALRCPIRHTAVVRVTDVRAGTDTVVCPEYEEPTGICRLKEEALSDPSRSPLVDRLSGERRGAGPARCSLL